MPRLNSYLVSGTVKGVVYTQSMRDKNSKLAIEHGARYIANYCKVEVSDVTDLVAKLTKSGAFK